MSKVVQFRPNGAGEDVPYFLTGSESRRHGVDLGRAVHDGVLTPTDFRELLALCRACPDGQGQRGAAAAADIACQSPDWCANRAVLEGLRGMV